MAAAWLPRRAVLAVLGASAVPVRAQRRPDVPFVVTPMRVVDAMLDLAALRPGETLIDLGSGDGRIVLAAARRGAQAMGIEIDPELVDRARRRAELEGLQSRARFSRGDLFEAVIGDANIVTIYLLTRINQRLRPKLLTELRAGTRVVSHAFDMGDWRPDGQQTVEDKQIYLWVVPAVVGGEWRLTLDGATRTVRFEQRYQHVVGELDGQPIPDTALRGDRFFFRMAGRAFHGIVEARTILPDPAHFDGVRSWRMERP